MLELEAVKAGQSNAKKVKIATARLADNRLWSEVLNWGGYDLPAASLEKEPLAPPCL